jgi:TPR repeat protein
MYRDGHGVPQDFELAAKLFSDGAQQGFSDAQMALGEMYAKGQGVPQDFVQAHFWFNVAGTKVQSSSGIKRMRHVT